MECGSGSRREAPVLLPSLGASLGPRMIAPGTPVSHGALSRQPHTSDSQPAMSSHLNLAAGVNHPATPSHPLPPSKPWKASASPSARRASAQSLLVLPEEERVELEDCFIALGGLPTGVIGIKHITKAYKLVLGPEQASDKVVKAAFDTMGPNINGLVDKMAFRSYMLNNWSLAPPPAGRRRSAPDVNFETMRLSDIVRMFRRKTLAERTFKKAQLQVHTVLHSVHDGAGDAGSKAGHYSGKDASQGRRSSGLEHSPSPPTDSGRGLRRSLSKRGFEAALEAQRAAAAHVPVAGAAVVPLSRLRRASMLMLEAALAVEKQPPLESMEEVSEHEHDSCSSACTHEDSVHEETAGAEEQCAWEQRVLALCRLNSGYLSCEAGGSDRDSNSPCFLPVEQLLIPQTPELPEQRQSPRWPRDPVTGQRSQPTSASQTRFSLDLPRGPAASQTRLSLDSNHRPAVAAQAQDCPTSQVADAADLADPAPVTQACSQSAAAAAVDPAPAASSAPPPDIVQSMMSAAGQTFGMGNDSWQLASGDGSEALSQFGTYANDGPSGEDSSSSSSSSSESGSDVEDPQAGVARHSGAEGKGGLTSWVAKRLTRFVHRDDEPASDDPTALTPRSSSLLSTMGTRRGSTLQRSVTSQLSSPTPRSPSLLRGVQRGLSSLDSRSAAAAMPLPAGGSVESLLRRVGSTHGLLPSVGPATQLNQPGGPRCSPAGSRAALQVPSLFNIPVAAKAKSSILGMARTDKAIVDVHWKMAQKSFRTKDRWNLT